MIDLVEFLRARLDEDEANAKGRAVNAPIHLVGCFFYDSSIEPREWAAEYCDCGPEVKARTLAEVKAKRAIVERVPAVHEHYAPEEREWEWCPKAIPEEYAKGTDLQWGPDAPCTCGADSENAKGGNWFLRVLASVYADHPDYRSEWSLG